MAAFGAILAMIPAAVWKFLAVVILVVAAYFYGDIKATERVSAKYIAADKAAELAATQQDLQAAKDGRAQDLEITNALLQKQKDDDVAIQDLKAKLAAAPPDTACLYPPSPKPKPSGLRLLGGRSGT